MNSTKIPPFEILGAGDTLLLFFTEKLMDWFAGHHRPMPWKGEKNPYFVWLSEVILQQTRVEQGLPYFEKFKTQYPDIQSLANAPEDEVMKLWEGLGYYSRARNLHAAAKYVAFESGGKFPDTYASIRQLKGVGDYTAAAIASFAYDLPHAVVDGNVYRVLARFFGIETPIDSMAGKKQFGELAQSLLDESQPGRYNQALMDFGATQCTPLAPRCGACPFREKCVAFLSGKVNGLPVKSKKPGRRIRFFNYLIINQQGGVFIKKRTAKDIWQNLYDFPLIETEAMVDDRQFLQNTAEWQAWLGGQAKLLRVSAPFRQELTHQKIIASFWEVEVATDFCAPSPEGWIKTERQRRQDFAFPKIIDLYFQEKLLPLELF